MDEPPRITNAQVREWNEAIKDWRDQTTLLAGYSPQHPAFLWKFCWDNLNTIRIPLFPAELFFEKAIKIAQEEGVTTGRGFMQRFTEEISEVENRWAMGFDIIHHHLQNRVFHHELGTPYSPSQDALNSVRHVYDNRTFYGFLELLRGITSGWRPDSTIESEENYVPGSCDPSEHDLYKGCYGHDYKFNEILRQPEVMEIRPQEYAISRRGSPNRANIKLCHHNWLNRFLYGGETFYPGQYSGRHHCNSDCNYGIPPDGVPTQPGELSQKRKKKVRFDGSPDDDNKQRSKRQKLERSTADSSSSYASSPSTEHVQRGRAETSDQTLGRREEERPTERIDRQMPDNNNAGSPATHASSSHTEHVEGERPAKRIKREMPENDNAGSLLLHASSSRTERVEEESSAGRLERQGREFATADSSLSPIPSPTRSARGAKRLRRQKREPATAGSSLSAVPPPTRSARGAAKRLRRRVSQSRTTDSPNTRTSRSNRGTALWELDRDGEPVEVKLSSSISPP
ncbi:hypothetical protein ACQKWADRAFT_307683 [Trichoderma austrokoningii]